MFSSFLTDVMTLAGFGALLDTVLMGKKEREKIERYLDGATGFHPHSPSRSLISLS